MEPERPSGLQPHRWLWNRQPQLLWTKWPLVVLVFLTATKKLVLAWRINQEQAVWASRVAWEQMTLASLIDAATWDSFWWSIMPSFQTALCLLASMDPLVFSRSSRALLALVQTSARSLEGLMLLLLETAAIGEMLVGISSREAFVPQCLLEMRCWLTEADPLASGVEPWGPSMWWASLGMSVQTHS